MQVLHGLLQRQGGMTPTSILFVLLAIGFTATAAVKLGPAYADNHVVQSALQDVQKQFAGADMQEVSDTEIKGKLSKYFQVNMVSDEVEKNVKVTRVKEKVTLSDNYEVRTNFMGNVDVVLVFNNEVDLGH